MKKRPANDHDDLAKQALPLLTVFAKLVANEILRQTRSPSEVTHYGSGRMATLPPGKSRAWAVRNLKTIPGSHKIGRDWTISVEDFEAWLGLRNAPAKESDEDRLFRITLENAGLKKAG